MAGFVGLPAAGVIHQRAPAVSRTRPASAQRRCSREHLLDDLWTAISAADVDLTRVAWRPPADGGKGFGLVASQDVSPGEDLVAIPKHLGVCCSKAGQPSGAGPSAALAATAPWYSRTATPLYRDRAYYRSAGDCQEGGGPLLLWSEEELQMLGCGLLTATAKSFQTSARESHAAIGGLVPVDEWLLLNALALSRAFFVQQERTAMMAPIIDMANHSRKTDEINASTLWDTPKSQLRLVAQRSIRKGDEVTVCYSMSAAILLNQYGITDELCLESDPAFVNCGSLWDSKNMDFRKAMLTRGLAMPDSDGRLSQWQPTSQRLEQAVTEAGADYEDILQQTLTEISRVGMHEKLGDKDRMDTAHSFRSCQKSALLREMGKLQERKTPR